MRLTLFNFHKLIYTTEKDPSVIDAVLNEAGVGRPRRIIDTNAKIQVQSALEAASWDKRMYWLFGPPGCGKTYCATEIIRGLPGKAKYLRIDQFNRRAPNSLIHDIHGVLAGVAIDGKKSTNLALSARSSLHQIEDKFRQNRLVLVLDEVQQLVYRCLELIRDLFDKTQLSIVMIGSNAFDDMKSYELVHPSAKEQFARRIDDVYDLPHASVRDVILFLEAFGIKLEEIDYEEITRLISGHGDIDTLNRAVGTLLMGLDSEVPDPKKIGGADIIDAIRRKCDPPTRTELR
jgi:hypothetical protein